MTPERHKRAGDIFTEAANLSRDRREAFVAEKCAGDTELFREVMRLIAAHERAELGQPAGQIPPHSDETAPGPVRLRPMAGKIGRWQVVDTIGRGGFGTVYKAEQIEPFRKTVAIKVLTEGEFTPERLARFEAERQALARMNHPNITQIYDAGTTDEGRPYFVMEYVPGVAITDYCNRFRLTVEERLALFAAVCEAAHHVHERGVVHRDFKPANVLVTEVDGKVVPKIIDFGIAKATYHDLLGKAFETQHGLPIGTFAYMSPEQAENTPLDVDRRSDVYSLGVLLYELLIGALPFDLAQAAWDVWRRVICEDDPLRPSTRLTRLGEKSSTVAKQRHTDLHRLSAVLRGDLDWVTMMAMEKDRSRRYDSALAFADDIRRYLNGQPVQARPPSLPYKLQKSLKKHRRKYQAGAAIVATALLLTVAAAMREARQERKTRAERLVTVAWTLEGQKKFDSAAALFTEAKSLIPGLDQPWRGLGDNRVDRYFALPKPERTKPTARKLLDDALVDLARAQQLAPNHAAHWNAAAYPLLLQGNHAEALAAADSALNKEQDPAKEYWYHGTKARVLALQGDFERALDAARAGTERDPPTDHADHSKDGVRLVRALLEMQLAQSEADWERALSWLRRTKFTDRKDVRNMIGFAKLHLQSPYHRDDRSALVYAARAEALGERHYPCLKRLVAQAMLGVDEQCHPFVPDEGLRLQTPSGYARGAMADGDKESYNHFIIAIDQARRGHVPAATASFDTAIATVPAEFRSGQRAIADIDGYELLWIDTLDDLKSLCQEAARALGAQVELCADVTSG